MTTTDTLTFQDFLVRHFERREVQPNKGSILYYTYSQSCWEIGKQVAPFGFFQVEGWNEDYYRHIWTSDTHLSILTFCEGDVALEVCNDVASYQEAIVECHNFYVVNDRQYLGGAFTHIDNCPIAIAAVESQPKTWRYYRLRGCYSSELLAVSPDPQLLKQLSLKWFEENPNEGQLWLERWGSSSSFSKTKIEEEGLFDLPAIVSKAEEEQLRKDFREQILSKMSADISSVIFSLALYTAGEIVASEAVPLDWIESDLTGYDDRDKAASWLYLNRKRIVLVEKDCQYDYKGDPLTE